MVGVAMGSLIRRSAVAAGAAVVLLSPAAGVASAAGAAGGASLAAAAQAPAAPLARRQRRPLALGGPGRRTPGHTRRHTDQDRSRRRVVPVLQPAVNLAPDCPARSHRVRAPFGRRR